MVFTIETFDAGVGTVKLAWQTVLLVRNIKAARGDAQELKTRVELLFQLVSSVYTLLETRKLLDQNNEKQTLKPDHRNLNAVAGKSLDACTTRLLKINKKLRRLGSKEPMPSQQRFQDSVKYVVLDQGTIRELQADVEWYLKALQQSLQILQALENQNIQDKLEHIISLLQRGSIPRAMDEATRGVEKEMDEEWRNLEDCKEYAKSALSTYTGSIPPGSATPSIRITSAEVSDDGFSSPLPRAHIDDMENILEAPLLPNDADSPIADREHEFEGWDLELRHYEEQYQRELQANNLPGVENYLSRAIQLAEKLESHGQRAFHNRLELYNWMAQLHLEFERHSEAKSVLANLINRHCGQCKSTQEILTLAELYHSYATACFHSYQKHKNKSDLTAAHHFAYEKSYAWWFSILKKGDIDKGNPIVKDCIGLLVKIFDEQGDPFKAAAWRKHWLESDTSECDSVPGSSSPSSPVLPMSPRSFSKGNNDLFLVSTNTSTPPEVRSQTPLIDAIRNKDITRLQMLLDDGEDVEQKCDRGITPILHAASCQHTDRCICTNALRKLVEFRADLSPDGAFDPKTGARSAIEYAILASKPGNAEILKTLHGLGASLNEPSSEKSIKPLEFAIKHDQADAVKHLIQLGVPHDIPNPERLTLFHFAASYNARHTIKMLIQLRKEKLIDLTGNEIASGGLTPLMILARNAHLTESLATARALLKALTAKEVNAEDTAKRRALQFVIERPPITSRTEFATLLLDHGADGLDVYQKIRKQADKYVTLRDRLKERRNINLHLDMHPSPSPERRDSGHTSTNSALAEVVAQPKSPKGLRHRKDSSRSSGIIGRFLSS